MAEEKFLKVLRQLKAPSSLPDGFEGLWVEFDGATQPT